MDHRIEYIEKRVSKEKMINGILATLFNEQITDQEKEGYRLFQEYVRHKPFRKTQNQT